MTALASNEKDHVDIKLRAIKRMIALLAHDPFSQHPRGGSSDSPAPEIDGASCSPQAVVSGLRAVPSSPDPKLPCPSSSVQTTGGLTTTSAGSGPALSAKAARSSEQDLTDSAEDHQPEQAKLSDSSKSPQQAPCKGTVLLADQGAGILFEILAVCCIGTVSAYMTVQLLHSYCYY